MEYEQDYLDAIIAFEQGDLDEEGTIALFQRLIDNGQAWNLQGSYGRTAHHLIEAGLCTAPEAKHVCDASVIHSSLGTK